jgi:putative zinc finger/helix-turn-helix YgiT family protein
MRAFCPACEALRDTRRVEREETYEVRNQLFAVNVTVAVCAECGESLGSDEEDQEILDAVYAKYRRENDLLAPDEIKNIRKQYRLSQKSFAALLGMSEATINRYEKGGLQDGAHDAAIRACQDPEFLRGQLRRHGHLLSQWQRKRVQEALAGEPDAEAAIRELLGDASWVGVATEVSDRTGYKRFDYQRFASVVVWFCQRLDGILTTTINKLLFYADFLYFKVETVSLTGTAYRRLQYGPAPAHYGHLLDRMEAEGILTCTEVPFGEDCTGYLYNAGPEAKSLDAEFTAREEAVLKHVAESLGPCTATEISRRSHEEAAWLGTEEKQLISYQKAAELSLDLPL